MKTLSALNVCIVLIICAISNDAFSQLSEDSKIINYDTTAYEGIVKTAKGENLNGKIVFNDNFGLVTLHQGNESRTFNSKTVMMFEFFDVRLDRKRTFISLEFLEPDTGMKAMHFFEVLRELNEFALLVRIDRVTNAKNPLTPDLVPNAGMPGTVTHPKKHQVKQTRTVYFINANGLFEPYLKITEIERHDDLFHVNRERADYINSELFAKYTAPHFRALAKFAKENKLSFKDLGDVMTILDKYEQILDHYRQ